MPRFSLENATFEMGGKQLLGPNQLEIDPEGVIAVVGPNGAGKSLLLALLHGLILPTKGNVLWEGSPVQNSMRRRGFMFQETPVMRRSVADNVGFPLIGRGHAKGIRTEKVQAALAEARLTEKSALPAAMLSGGERQRMALARALVTGPELILLDEPGAALDPASEKRLEAMIRRVVESGVPVLMTTHDISQARRLADQAIFLHQGKILERSAADTFFDNPASTEAQNYLNGVL